MAFEKLKTLAEKCGHTHLSLEFLMEFKECVPEFEDFMNKGRELFAPITDDEVELEDIECLQRLYYPGDLDIVGDGIAPAGAWSVHLRDGTEVKAGPMTFSEAQKWVDDHTGV